MSNRFPKRREKITPDALEEQTSLTVRQIHQGPLPSPDDLVRYEEAMPGLADTIVAMAESEQEHRHKMETIVVKSFSFGPRYAFLLGVLSITATLILFLKGVGWPALFLIPTGLIPSALSSLVRKNDQ